MPRYKKRPCLNFEEEFLDSVIAQALLEEEDNKAKGKKKKKEEEENMEEEDGAEQKAEKEKEKEEDMNEEDGEEQNNEKERVKQEGDNEEEKGGILRTPLISAVSSQGSFPSSLLMFQGTSDEEEESFFNMLSIAPLLNPLSSSSSSSLISLSEESSREEDENLSPLQLRNSKYFLKKFPSHKVTELVKLLILKYRMKEPITKLQMLKVVTEDYKKYFPMIFEEASKCLEVIYGIDIKENDPVDSSYILTNSLNLTYEDDDMQDENEGMPTNGFLILTLAVIFMEGNCASEESIWKFLNMMAVYEGEKHFVYGQPTKLLTSAFVEKKYLECRQVPDSEPPHYEFQWGARAYAETTKMKVLEFLGKVTGRDPVSFSLWYGEALRDEEEKGCGRLDLTKDSASAQNGSTACAAQIEESVFEESG